MDRPKVGRPALGVKATMVRLSPAVLARIDALEGAGKRAAFIRRAVDRALEEKTA
jgi:predicted DNA-binding protein